MWFGCVWFGSVSLVSWVWSEGSAGLCGSMCSTSCHVAVPRARMRACVARMRALHGHFALVIQYALSFDGCDIKSTET